MKDAADKKEYYYVVKVFTDQGEKYLFNERTFVSHINYAKRYSSRDSAQRIARKVRAKDFRTEIFCEEVKI